MKPSKKGTELSAVMKQNLTMGLARLFAKMKFKCALDRNSYLRTKLVVFRMGFLEVCTQERNS